MTLVDAPSPTSAHAGDPGADAPPRKPPRPWQTLRGAPGDRLRIGVALGGLLAIGVAEGLVPGPAQDALADVGVLALLVAAVLVLLHRRPAVRGDGSVAATDSAGNHAEELSRRARRGWRWTLAGLAIGAALVAQTWFRSGTAIAGGDIAPPIGTAWISRLFAAFGYSGTNLGGPVDAAGQLPWATLDWLVHVAGGSGALAQRIWLTALLAAVPVAAAALARALRLSPAAGVAAGLLYAFSPYVLSVSSVSDVDLIALALLAALPAAGAVTNPRPLRLRRPTHSTQTTRLSKELACSA